MLLFICKRRKNKLEDTPPPPPTDSSNGDDTKAQSRISRAYIKATSKSLGNKEQEQ
jgi:hypothetical protein